MNMGNQMAVFYFSSTSFDELAGLISIFHRNT